MEASSPYADASALVKLVLDEPESEALVRYLDELGSLPLASSAIVRVEVSRAVTLAKNLEAVDDLSDLLAHLTYVPVSDIVLYRAQQLADLRLRSLDAIHLASALTVGARQMLVYDHRLARAAEAAGLEVLAPGA